jgi:hypothetical protein
MAAWERYSLDDVLCADQDVPDPRTVIPDSILIIVVVMVVAMPAPVPVAVTIPTLRRYVRGGWTIRSVVSRRHHVAWRNARDVVPGRRGDIHGRRRDDNRTRHSDTNSDRPVGGIRSRCGNRQSET